MKNNPSSTDLIGGNNHFTLFETVPDLYLILSPQLDIITASNAYLQATFTVREEITGRNVFEVFPDNPETPEANSVKNLSNSLNEVLTKKQAHEMAVQRYDVLRPAADGEFEKKYWKPLNTPVLDTVGNVAYIIHKVTDVTELVETHGALQQSRKSVETGAVHFRSVVENTPDVITRWDKDLRLLFANSAFEQKTGTKNENLYGKNNQEMGQPDEIALPWMERLRNVFETGKATEHYNAFPTPKGEAYFFSRMVPEINENGEIETVLAIARDITDLRKAEEQFRMLVTATSDVVYKMNADWTQLYQLEGKNALADTHFENNSWLEKYIPLSDHQLLRSEIERATLSKSIFELEHRVIKNDGRIGWISSRAVPLLSKEGEIESWVGAASDITGRKNAEAELIQKQELLEATMNSTLEMIQVFEAVRNNEGEIIDFRWVLNNHASESIYGDVIGKSLLKLNPGVKEAGIFETFKEVIESGVPNISERHYVYEQFDGWYYQSVVKLNDGVATSTANITQRKKAELELRESKALLQVVIDAPNIGIAVYKALRDETGRIIDFVHEFINRTTLADLGQDFTGRLLSEHGEDGRSQLSNFIEVIESGKLNRYIKYSEFGGSPHWISFSNTPLDNDRLVHTWEDITERKMSEQELIRVKEELAQKATKKYLELFQSIDQGFCTITVKYGAEDEPVDYQFIEVSPSFEYQTGIQNAAGKWMRDIAADQDEFWFKVYGRIAKDRKSERFEYFSTPLGRWWSVYAFPIGEPELHQIGVLFNDITKAKIEEERQAYLLRLSDALKELTDPVDIQKTACRILGEHLKVNRVLYGEVIDEKLVVISNNYVNGVQPLIATLNAEQFGEDLIAAYKRNEKMVFNNVSSDARLTENDRENFASIQVVANASMGLLKGGRWVAAFGMHQNTPREWTSEDILLMDETAERTWAAVERAKAEEALRKSQAELAAVFEVLPVGIGFVDPDGKMIFSNKEMLRYLPNNVIPSKDDERYNKWIGYNEDKTRIERSNFPGARALKGESVVPGIEMLYQESESNEIWARVAAVPITDNEGKTIGAVSVVNDISELKRKEDLILQAEINYSKMLEAKVEERTADLQKSRDMLQSVFDTTLISMFILEAVRSKQGKILDLSFGLVNREFERETGRNDLVGKLFSAEYPGVKKAGLFDTAIRVMETGEPARLEYFYPYEGFNKWYSAMYVKLNDGLVVTNLDITQRKETEQKLKQAEDEKQKEIVNAVMQTQEEERRRIAEALHNEFGQLLSIAKFKLPKGSLEAEELLNRAITVVRSISHELMPSILQDYGLQIALKDLCDSKLLDNGINCTSVVSGLNKRLNPIDEIAVYRIIQEIINNIVKHSQASVARIEIERSNRLLSIKIEDKGIGIKKTGTATMKKSFGLQYIANRVHMLKGELDMQSEEGKGVKFYIRIPLQE